jgi:hypothetical protein
MPERATATGGKAGSRRGSHGTDSGARLRDLALGESDWHAPVMNELREHSKFHPTIHGSVIETASAA